ncbi:NrsF family protein [Sphingomonas sp. AX6]|uniref:NrsF family protein n=1 Tax=Sphingomonas sp. AX6 TaxID=2653171 RepID=UPI0012F3F043|nr:DUF1109 domain-containing protein [Sphingomonas sp. AX6]VXC96050.1 conserved membrane hypothetical protein [Sphingomonas sp. AX6]
MSQYKSDTLIDELVGDLRPVRPISVTRGLIVAGASLAVTLAAAIIITGLRWNLTMLAASPVYIIATGSFLLLGFIASLSVVLQSKPQVGADHSGWKWAALMLGILPLAALVSSLDSWHTDFASVSSLDGLGCVMAGTLFGLLTFVALTVWQRKGAPTNPARAGLLTGVASGCFGIAGFSLSCAHADIIHIGIWHTGAVLACALLGRVVVPPLLRW